MAENERFLKLNIGGKSFQIKSQTVINRCKSSLLARFVQMCHSEKVAMCDGYFADTQEYYFERSTKEAEAVVDFFMTGFLHKPTDLCPQRFYEELKYWNIPRKSVAFCCRKTDPPPPLLITTTENGSIEEEKLDSIVETEGKDLFEDKCWARHRRILWDLCENPQSSWAAKLYALVSISFVLISVTGLILGSMPELQTIPAPNELDNSTENDGYAAEGEPLPVIIYAEYICVAWFATEYSIRFAIAPQKWQFFAAPLNLIDLFTILPFGVELALPWMGYDNLNQKGLRKFSGAMLVMRVLRVLRVARVFKLARYSKGLQGFGDTMGKSVKELSMLSMFLFTGIIFFSTLLYFLEKDTPNSKFKSIPEACWWCVITMTTVGYGDVVPTTWAGKVVATMTSVCGIIVLAFPISMIVDKFAKTQDLELSASSTSTSLLVKPRPKRRFRTLII